MGSVAQEKKIKNQKIQTFQKMRGIFLFREDPQKISRYYPIKAARSSPKSQVTMVEALSLMP
jgi:hypothetical protein